MLRKLFTSKTRVKLLTLFIMNPGREMYVREIARTTKENINAILRELTNLEGIGLLKTERRGNLKYHVINYVLFTVKELEEREKSKDPFIVNMLKESKIIRTRDRLPLVFLTSNPSFSSPASPSRRIDFGV